MNELIWFLATAAAGVAGGTLAIRKKVPVGGIIGGMLAVILLNVITGGRAVFYKSVKVAVQLTVGTMCGSKIGKSDIRKLRDVIIPVLIIFPLMIVYNLVFGVLVFKLSSLDVYTSFYSLSPGSVADIAIIAEDLGADRAVVGLIHAIRVLACSSLIPGILGIMKRTGRIEKTGSEYFTAAENDTFAQQTEIIPSSVKNRQIIQIIVLFLFSMSGGLIFYHAGINGGAIIGSMIFAAIFSCIFGKRSMPKWLKRIQQMSTGTYIGSGITLATLLSAKLLVLPIVLLLLDILVSTFLSSYLVLKTKKMDLVSAMASCNPGGLTEMLLVTDEMGGDVSSVAVIHTFRLFFVITTFPPIINTFTQFIM